MSLLDWFAGQAISATVGQVVEDVRDGRVAAIAGASDIAALCFTIAEAMVAESRRRQEAKDEEAQDK